jgi:glycosyltransferase involved in cell wall biosynthesis
MKILHVINNVNPAGGGPIEGINQIATCLMETPGNEVHIASSDSPDADYIGNSPIPVKGCGPGLLRFSYAPQLVAWIRQNHTNYDVVVVNGLWGYSGRAVRQALRGTSTPYVVFTHGMLDPWFKRTYPLKHLKKLIYWHLNEYMVLKDARAVLFTCEEERVLAHESFACYNACEFVIAYGTGSPKGDAAVQKNAFTERFPEVRAKRIVLFIGRIHPKKGLDLAIDAFGTILGNHPDWHLVIAGPDTVGLKKKLLSLAESKNISSRITWTGLLQGDLKWGAIHSAEVMLLPSHQENFGIVVAESLACGVPALISNKVNIWREIEQDRAGFVADDTAEGTRELLRKWIAMSNAERSEMSVRAKRSFFQRFEIHKTTEGLTSLFAGLETGPVPRYVQGWR